MRDISACRADIARRETAVADLQRRLQGELQPLRDDMLAVRIDTFRVLGNHLRAGWLNKRSHKLLELALYDFANELEAEFGAELRADRNRIFAENGIGDGGGGDEDEDRFGGTGEEDEADEAGEKGGDPGAYRESDFDKEREGRGDWDSPGVMGRNEGGVGRKGKPGGGKGSGGARSGQSGTQPRGQAASRDEALAGDIRALYLMLARALHPDKESDPLRLEAKTAWMQKVTAAYAARDLARLLDILASDPLEAVGPYLSQAPLKTVQGFAKRLRRELDALRQRFAHLESALDPLLGSLMKQGSVNETAYTILMAQVRKELKFMKQRRDAYRTTQGLNGLVEALRGNDWRLLM
ncbi:MAG: hypothetical protein ABIQ80_21300 [Fibrobacteria bacterium]